jgi:formate/nitrite transporter FocA (FNT family)
VGDTAGMASDAPERSEGPRPDGGAEASPGDVETQAAQRDILEIQIQEGLSELRRPADGLLLSALSAGLDVGFGPFFMAVVLTTAGGSFASPLAGELVLANAYAIGFVFVVLGRSELFTEHTTLAVLPVLDGRASLRQLARLWGTVYAGNVAGGVAFAAFAVAVAPGLGAAEPSAFVAVAESLLGHTWPAMLGGSVLAGWLMGLLSWLVAAAKETTSRIAFVWLIAGAIGFAHLPHSIAGTVEVVAGVLVSSDITVVDWLWFLAVATVGNAVGGTIFVSLLKYGHVVKSGPEPADA